MSVANTFTLVADNKLFDLRFGNELLGLRG